jgi:hypothetical protein
MSEYLYITFKTQHTFNVPAVLIGQQVQEAISNQVPANIHQHFRVDVRIKVISAKKIEVELEPIIWGYDFRALHSKKKKRKDINIVVQALIQWAKQHSPDVCVSLVSERPERVAKKFVSETVSPNELTQVLSKNLSRDNVLYVIKEDS